MPSELTEQDLRQELEQLRLKNHELKRRIHVLSRDQREQTSLINVLLEKSPFGVLILDASRNVLRINRSAENILGISRTRAIGKNCSQIFNCYQEHNGCPELDEHHNLDREETPCNIDGTHNHTLLRSTMTGSDQGETIIIEGFVDISDIKAAQEATQQAIRAKDDFISKMSHELRTPLNAVIGFSDLLHDEFEEAGESKWATSIAKVRRAGFDMLHLVEDLLDFGRIQANKLKLEITVGNVHELLEILNNTVTPLLLQNKNTLTIECDAEIYHIETDIFRLRQVLLNLVSNANKFTDNGTIRIAVKQRLEKQRKWIQFEVTDSGIGMTEEEMARIFEAFEQADNSSTRKHQGVGLGLTISKELVQLMGGNIQVSSVPGEGTTFTVTLPETCL